MVKISERIAHFMWGLKGAVSTTFSVAWNGQKTYFYGCKRQNNVSVLLKITCTETSITHLYLRIARMEMGCNLTEMANFFKFWPMYLGKMAKK